MSKQKSIGVNAVLNVIRQGLSVLFPLITYPYALRVLGVEAIGKVNYGNSIISYFILIAMLGVTNYAVREGAKRKEVRRDFEEFASEIFSINLLATLVSYVLFGCTLLFVGRLHNYTVLLLIQSLSIILSALSIEWVNTVYEDFLLITIRSIATHLISLVLLFLLVKSPDDYYIYAFLSVITNGIICVTNLVHCRKYVKLRFTLKIKYRQHLKPIFILFANSLAISIYVNLDTTMLGWMKGDYYVGIYSVAVKVYSIAKNMMAAIYVVSVPRLSLYAGKEDWNSYKGLSTNIIKSLCIILLPAGIGLICLAPEIMLLLGGAEYVGASLVLQILGGALIFAIFGGYVTAGINISLGREKYTLIATVMSSLLNFGLNLICIPMYAHNGAALTTLISELFVLVLCFSILPNKGKYMDVIDILETLSHAAVGCLAIILITLITKKVVTNYILVIGIVIVFSIFFYFLILKIFRDRTFELFLRSAKNKLKMNKR